MCVVEGLPGEELRQITSRPDTSIEPGEKYRRVEFNTPAYNMLNALEKLGYRSIGLLYIHSNQMQNRAVEELAKFEATFKHL